MRKNRGPNIDLYGVPALIVSQLEYCHLKRVFDVYYRGMTQSIKEHSPLFHCSKLCIKDFHARPCQFPLINLEKHLVLLGKNRRQKYDKYYELLK